MAAYAHSTHHCGHQYVTSSKQADATALQHMALHMLRFMQALGPPCVGLQYRHSLPAHHQYIQVCMALFVQ